MLYLQWKKWTYKQYYDDANTTAKGFIKLGLEPRKTVAILGFNAPEWFISEMGAIFAGKLNIRLEQYAEICEADPYIMCSAGQSSAYCHYFFFFGRHNHSISTPRGEYGQICNKFLSTVAPKNMK